MGVNPVKRMTAEAYAMQQRYESRLAAQSDLITMAGVKLMRIRDIAQAERHNDVQVWDSVAAVVAGTRDSVERAQEASWLADAQAAAVPAFSPESIHELYKHAFILADGKGPERVSVEFAKLLGINVL